MLIAEDVSRPRAMSGELDHDLLMLDLNRPRVVSQFCGSLRNRKSRMPILILTGHNHAEDPCDVSVSGPMTSATALRVPLARGEEKAVERRLLSRTFAAW